MTVETFVVVIRCTMPGCDESTTITSIDGPVFAELVQANLATRSWGDVARYSNTKSGAICPACVRRITTGR